MNQNRKIVIIGPAFPLRGGGISTFNERLARAYQDLGHEVVIYTFSLQYPSIFFPGTTQYSKEPPPEHLNIKVRLNSINPFSWFKTGRQVVNEKPDLVIVRFWIPFMGPSLGTVCRIIKKAGIKVVAIVDNIIPHEKKIMDRVLARYFVHSVNYFIAMSKSVLEDLEGFDASKPKKLTVHPLYDNFGDPVSRHDALEHLGLSHDYQYILFFGFIRDYKGLDILLHAFGDSRFRKMPLKLLVVGEFYTDPEPYHKIIEAHNLGDQVIMHNEFVPNTGVVNYFCAANLVVQPYKDATQSGITQIAYHFNKPMITTNVGGLSETIIHNKVGFVVNPQAEELADAMETFFRDKLEERFTAHVEEEKKRFSWKIMIDAIDEVSK